MQWSGQRGSNPRPQPWQGCALPTEPCPLARKYYTRNPSRAQASTSSAQDLLFKRQRSSNLGRARQGRAWKGALSDPLNALEAKPGFRASAGRMHAGFGRLRALARSLRALARPLGARAASAVRTRAALGGEGHGKGALSDPCRSLEAKPGFEPGVKALQASALPLGHFAGYEKGRSSNRPESCNGADNGARTRDPNLGKVVLYQLSHVRLRGSTIREF